MSRHRSAPGAPSTRIASSGAGRHRVGSPAGVRCSDIPAVRQRMTMQQPVTGPRNAFLRWLVQTPPAGRHTWTFLAGNGGRPRTAFAIILSL